MFILSVIFYVITLIITINGNKPNIILIVTDDQDVVLQGMFPMIATQKLLGLKGITFSNAFTSSPICCPSRSSILSGLYAHNHHTYNNSESGGCYGHYWKKKIQPKALPVILQQNGYETFFAGKYLNRYYEENVPPGWQNFYGLHGNSKYYNYNLTENGKIVSYNIDNDPNQYLTDVLSNKIHKFLIERRNTEPFFAMITPPSAHAPYTPANRHNATYIGTKALRTPNFNMLSGVLDKHWLIASGTKISDQLLKKLDEYYQKRWSSLLAVDEMIERIITTLEQLQIIDNTYIIFTSDNGYHIGQFAQPYDKRQPYETDIRVPFLVRGPNIPAKSMSTHPIALIDIFPTILEWANIKLLGNEDGISFNSIAMKSSNLNANNHELDHNFHRQILIEYWGEGNDDTYNSACPWKITDHMSQCTLDAECHCQDTRNNTYACVRHFAYNTDKVYCEFKDTENFVEAYDLNEDPYQMKNLGYEMLPIERAMYSLSLQNLTKCKAETCRKTILST